MLSYEMKLKLSTEMQKNERYKNESNECRRMQRKEEEGRRKKEEGRRKVNSFIFLKGNELIFMIFEPRWFGFG